jgi:hypothetical protein
LPVHGRVRRDRAKEIWRIHYDLDFSQPVDGHKAVWELNPDSITRLNALLRAWRAE